MNAPLDARQTRRLALADAVAIACDRIAPTWPLDRLIAVNPWWGWREQPIDEAAATLGVLCGSRLTAPTALVHDAWRAGRLRRAHLQAALRLTGDPMPLADLEHALTASAPGAGAPALPSAAAALRLPLVTDHCDATGTPWRGTTWTTLVTQQISQHCAAFFDTRQAGWQPGRDDGLYGQWRQALAADRAIPWRSGGPAGRDRVAALPDAPLPAIETTLAGLGVPAEGHPAYLTALLLSVNGWAAWCAWRRWEARLEQREDDLIVDLLAIRLAWEGLLAEDLRAAGALPAGALADWAAVDRRQAALARKQRIDWLLQRALELADQAPLARALAVAPRLPAAANAGASRATPGALSPARPPVQAVFCIDVRSEPMRLALETAWPQVATTGFAGFFGLPLAHQPVGTELTQPRLPGLLAPQVVATEQGPAAARVAARRGATLGLGRRWTTASAMPATPFSLVEALGLGAAVRLLNATLRRSPPPAPAVAAGLDAEDASTLRPALTTADGPGHEHAVAAAAALARDVLRAMGLTQGFARLVLLVGHGSSSTANAHAAALDCGACGGQRGDLSARVLAGLLNDPAVRAALAPLGIALPADTHVLPALHDTTTDEVTLFDTDAVPASHADTLARLRAALDEAGQRTRARRAPALGLAPLADDPQRLLRALRARAADWSEVRPEWGLAGNAALVVAPRARTRHLDLGGRCFLHDYDWRTDTDGRRLTLILTAPMVVANWINLQYHGSVVDPQRHGSGDKVLHNVVGGHIGVFEGSGGDLRIGLPWQSVHDGERLRHLPVRLSVYVEAPRAAIDAVMAAHPVVRQLAGNGWLHLHTMDPVVGGLYVFDGSGWTVHPLVD